MSRVNWFKRDTILLKRLREEDEKLKKYFNSYDDDKLTIYSKRLYHRHIKDEIKFIQRKLDNYRRKQRIIQKDSWKNLTIEEKLGRLMYVKRS